MKESTKETGNLTRRRVLSLLGFGTIVTSFGATPKKAHVPGSAKSEQTQILLTADGRPVKIKSNALSQVKTLKKHVSNKKLLGWLSNNQFKK